VGHVAPSLAVAEALRRRGAQVTFAGTPDRIEARLVPEAGYELDTFRISGLPRRPSPEKLAPYECGMPPVGDARDRHPVKFYLVAMIFLLFDIEIAFLYPWALAVRELRWTGFFQLMVFFLILLAGYVYVWRKGVFDWGHEERA